MSRDYKMSLEEDVMELKPTPNEPCWCGSGRKYKKCHKRFDEAPNDLKYQAAQQAYSATWKTTSELQYARGDYAWMAEQLKPYNLTRLFDVGSGSGHGLLAMSEAFPNLSRIVSVDENLDCLRIARDTLVQRGASPSLLTRLETALTPEGFVQSAKPFSDPLPAGVVLIEADPLTDPYLEEALLADGPFDAVTIWLTGAHMLRSINAISRSRAASDERDLRIILQNEVYEMADRILRPGGVLQVVDRSEPPTSDYIRDEYFKAHREQAEPTTLDVRDVAYQTWTPPDGSATKLIQSAGEGRTGEEIGLALVSITSVKT